MPMKITIIFNEWYITQAVLFHRGNQIVIIVKSTIVKTSTNYISLKK